MKGKASWFCIIMACGFLVLAAVERQVYQDDLGAAVAIVSAVVLGGLAFVLLKLDEIIRVVKPEEAGPPKRPRRKG